MPQWNEMAHIKDTPHLRPIRMSKFKYIGRLVEPAPSSAFVMVVENAHAGKYKMLKIK